MQSLRRRNDHGVFKGQKNSEERGQRDGVGRLTGAFGVLIRGLCFILRASGCHGEGFKQRSDTVFKMYRKWIYGGGGGKNGRRET